jgi:hypothetical protein
MKLTIDIDCTPQEARTFFGLPDVEALNAMIVEEMTERAQANMDTLADPEKFMAQAMNMGGKGMEAMQAMMIAAMSGKK